jgi:hypothetical protein
MSAPPPDDHEHDGQDSGQIMAFNRGRIARHQRELFERLDPRWGPRHAAEG